MAKADIIVGLDIGSSKIKFLAAQKNKKEENLEVLGLAEEDSFGVRRGVVIDPAKVANIIQSALQDIQEKTKQRINSVYVNVGGSHIFSTSSRGLVSVSRADQKISAEDIDRVLNAAQTFSLPLNREILDVVPKEFIIDGEKGIKEPEGLKGLRLEAEVMVLGGFIPYLKNLTSAVLNSELQKINDRILNPIASARAVLTPREKELGVAVLDIGSGTTDLAVFEEGQLVHLNIFPVGSSNLTNDIAVFYKTDFDLAEKIKIEFGTCFFQGSDKKEKIELDDEEQLVFSKKQLANTICARVSEIFGEVNKELKKIQKAKLPAGIVLTGGGAKLSKIRDFAKKEFKLPCRIGKPQGFSSLEEDSSLATVCGLVLTGVRVVGDL